MAEMTGAQIVCETLRAEGVNYMFGTTGTTEVPFLDALVGYPEVEFILALHESQAVAMADGYARACGRPGVILVHTTPGTCNALGNLFNAHCAGAPLVVIAGQQDTRLLLREPSLASELVALVRQFAKWSWQLNSVEDFPIAMRRAFKVATTPPTGPVYLALPRNMQEQKTEADILPPERYSVPMRQRGDPGQVSRAAELLTQAERPAIVAGYGISRAQAVAEAVELAELVAAVVCVEPHAAGMSFPTDHPLCLCPGALDASELRPYLEGADVVLAVGSRVFRDHTFSPTPALPREAKLIHLDADPWEIAKNYPADVAIVADPQTGLRELITGVKLRLAVRRGRSKSPGITELKAKARFAAIAQAREEARHALAEELRADADAVPIPVWRVVKEVRALLPPDGVLVDESVRAVSYVRLLFDIPQAGAYFTHSTSLGWGMAAAMGIKMAWPQRPVLALVGDGSAMFGLQSLWTARQYQIPATIVVLNNGSYMAVKRGLHAYGRQAAQKGKFIGVELGDTNCARLAQDFGIHGERVVAPQDLAPALRRALELGQPALVEVMVDPHDAGYRHPRIP